MKTRQQLMSTCLQRVLEKFPGVNAEKEREEMAGWSDYRLATAYLPDDTPDTVYEQAASMYDGAPKLDAEDIKSLV